MNSTTERFSRRLGEKVRGAEYAASISGTKHSNSSLWWLLAAVFWTLALSSPWWWK